MKTQNQESLKSFLVKCRLCLYEINESKCVMTREKKLLIEELCKEQLLPSKLLSSSCCQSCLAKIKLIEDFKTKITANQAFLKNLLDCSATPQHLEKEPEENVPLLSESKDLKVKEKKRDKHLKGEEYSDKKCPHCFKHFTEKRKIPLHIKRMHTKVKDFFCDNCDYSAFTRFDIVRHHKNIHLPKPESPSDRRVCPHCAKVVKGNNQLTLHIRKKHLNIKKFQCDLCPFSSYGKYEIRSHLQHVHIPKQFKNAYPCKLCESVLISAVGLKVHVQHKHSGVKPFSCFCGKAFSLKETLKSHVRNVHDGQRKFACKLCPKRFGQAVRLRDHFNNSHGRKQEIPCLECNKVFHSARNLKAHMVYHSKPQFSCLTCGKMFYLSNKLKDHQKLHDPSSEHICPQCSKTFKLLASLKRHIKQHEKQL